VDIRLDADGRAHFIECNPLPGLAPGWSDLCVIAEAAGMGYRVLVGEILSPALRRLREHRKERILGA
jgi:D-alanine-D-alanine ligase